MPLFRKKYLPKSLEPAPPGEGRDVTIRAEELVVAGQPFSRIADQFRRLRNSIQALNPDGAARTVLLTSAIHGEGTTVATINLGLAMVEVPHQRVLLIDAHIRDPELEEYLELPRRQGLSEVIRGMLPLDQSIRPTSVDRLDIIGAGGLPTHPGEGVNAERMQSILHTLKRRYDYILMDTPPVQLVVDPTLLGTVSDGIVLVVRLGHAPKHLVEETYNMLESLGGNVLGTVVTGADLGEQD